MLISRKQKKKVRKGSNSTTTARFTSSRKKKSKQPHKSRKENIDPGSLAPIPITEKKKRSSKSSAPSERPTGAVTGSGSAVTEIQPCLEKIISDIVEKLLNEKLGIISSFSSKVPNKQLQDTGAEDTEDEFIDDPMEIDFVQTKEPATDVATVKCKIKRLVIPGAVVDPGANFAIMSEDIAKRLKLEIDTKEKHDLKGVATVPTESLGTIRNVPINFAPGCTIYSDFAVIKYPKPMLILPNTLLGKYNYDLLASRRQLRLECDGKEFFIPINMHKVKNKLEVNCVNIASPALLQEQAIESTSPALLREQDCVLQDLDADDILKKNMKHGELKERIKELEKKLYITLKSKAELNDFCERLQIHYSKLLG